MDPHINLDSMVKELVSTADSTLSVLGAFPGTPRLAEPSSFGRIAENLLKVIDRFKTLDDGEDTDENDLQQLITNAPWLINAEWVPVTRNQTLSRLRQEFERYYQSTEFSESHFCDLVDQRNARGQARSAPFWGSRFRGIP